MRFKFHARQTSIHSPLTWISARKENCRKPSTLACTLNVSNMCSHTQSEYARTLM